MISVIVPVYNEEKYLKQCVDSLLAQSYRDLEIIIIDDGSTDGSSEICDEYEKRDSRVRVFHKENQGLAAAVKDGVKAARGKYIGFVDSDDWVEHDMYEVLYSTAEAHQADIVQCRICFGDNRPEDRLEYSVFYKKDIPAVANAILAFFQSDTPSFIPSRGCKLFRAQLVKDNLELYHDRICYGEDINFFFMALLSARIVVALPQTYLYHYRKNYNSITNNYKKGIKKNNDLLIRCLEKIFSLTDWNKDQLETYEIYLRYQEMKNTLCCPYGMRHAYRELKCEEKELLKISTDWSKKLNLYYESAGGKVGMYLLRKRYYRIAVLLYRIEQWGRKTCR